MARGRKTSAATDSSGRWKINVMKEMKRNIRAMNRRYRVGWTTMDFDSPESASARLYEVLSLVGSMSWAFSSSLESKEARGSGSRW